MVLVVKLLSIDPGNHTGWVDWDISKADKRFAIVAAGLGQPPPLSGVSDYEVIIERPEVYPRSKVPPNDIVKLAFTAGKLVGKYTCPVIDVLPRTWKGQVDKEAHNRQVMTELLRRLPASHARLSAILAGIAPSYRNNVIDAAGLGLWYAKQLLGL